MYDLGDPSFPYPSTIRPVVGRDMVIASQPLAAQAGLRMLELGGNAVDAAITAASVIAVVEPTNNGLGGDALAAVWDGDTLSGLNASGRAPGTASPQRMKEKYGNTMPERGWDSVTVPGAVSAWTALWRRYGSLPFEQLMAPAITYAANGFFVSPGVAKKWEEQADVLRNQPNFETTFLPGGKAPLTGQCFVQADLADTLTRIARSEGHDFYTGTTAARIAAFSAECNADLSRDDLASHRAVWTDMLGTRYRNACAYEMPPNGQGLIALYALGILEHLNIEQYPVDSPEAIHLQIEAIKLACAQVQGQLGDPDQMTATPSELLHPDHTRHAASMIDMKHAQDHQHMLPALAGTVYLATGDSAGRMVSLIQSNYMGFGSGVVVPGTGVVLQNRGAGFSLDMNSPARLSPKARPFHTILPGFLSGSDGCHMAFGATGGAFQPQGHVQLIVRLMSFGQNPQAVVDAPRFKVASGLKVSLEPGYSPSTIHALTELGHQITALETSTWDFGGMQILQRQGNCYIGARDARRDSHVAVS
jgi:gamma-glutamyltranspeptidase/glutathione hydrolase